MKGSPERLELSFAQNSAILLAVTLPAKAILTLACSALSLVAEDLVVTDFETPSYGDWLVAGETFGRGPLNGRIDTEHDITGFLEKWPLLCRDLKPRDGEISLRLLIDRMSVEAFSHFGEITASLILDPRLAPWTQQIVGCKVHQLTICELKSTWGKPGKNGQ